MLNVYEMNISISVLYDENVVFSCDYKNVIGISKKDTSLLNVKLKTGESIILKKIPQIGVIVKN
jgi:hypothetical protein